MQYPDHVRLKVGSFSAQGAYKFTAMDLIPYSFAPRILFLIPYTLDLLP